MHEQGKWHEQWLSTDRSLERTAVVSISLPASYTAGGSSTIDLGPMPRDFHSSAPDGNRAQRRAFRFGHRFQRFPRY